MAIYNIHTSCIDKGFYTIKSISEEDFVSLSNAVKHLQKVLYEMNLSLMLNQSYNQLIAGLNSNIEDVDDRFVLLELSLFKLAEFILHVDTIS